MNIEIGDLVQVSRNDAYVPDDPWTAPVQFGMLLVDFEWKFNNGDSPYRGKVVRIIKTKWFGLIKLADPIYIVRLKGNSKHHDLIYTTKLKKVIRM